MKAIDAALLERFLRLAGDRLRGRWVLLGGTLLPALGIEYRVTSDIDLVGIDLPDQSQTLELMKIAEELGLPIEAINQAAAFFLEKHQPYDSHLRLLRKGSSAEIYRPDPYLFVSLKAGRLTETDLEDCLALLAQEGAPRGRELATLTRRLEAEEKLATTERRSRLKRLVAALSRDPDQRPRRA